MAALAIPIATTVIPLVLPYVVKLMDKIFGSGTGATKLAAGTEVATNIMTQLQKIVPAGTSLPVDPKEIQQLLQSVVSDLNAQGVLRGSATVIDPQAIPVGSKNVATAAMMLDAAAALLRL